MAETLNYQIDEYYLDLQKQGQGMELMELIDEDETWKNPFPGLRPFRTSEAHLFFGRDGQSEALIELLIKNRFLFVLGNSGSGKSSLVRAGLIPAIHAGYRQKVMNDWKIVICRPGNSPLQNLAVALAGSRVKDMNIDGLKQEANQVLPTLRQSSFGLIKATEDRLENENILIIVDQFEELFRFSKEIAPGEAVHFVNLLINAVDYTESHIYVVTTMRSEFLGECVKYRGLPEIINSGQYLVPRLTGENLLQAMKGPLALVDAALDPAFGNRLVREVGDNMDQLPLLQHALMRSYERWQKGDSSKPLGHVAYDEMGGLDKALGNHADELYQKLDEKGKKIARRVFQRVTDLNAGEYGGRSPALMKEIYGICEAESATKEEVNRVIEHFRDLHTSFLMPPAGTDLGDDTMLDIAHESLIRNWDTLKQWAREEVDSARSYRRIDQGRREEDRLTPGILQRLSEWVDATPVNAYWAARYHEGMESVSGWEIQQQRFKDNMAFIEKERALLKKEQEDKRRIQKKIIWLLSSLTLLFFVTGVWALQERYEAVAAKDEAERQRTKAEEARTAAEAEKYRADSLSCEAINSANITAAKNLEIKEKADSLYSLAKSFKKLNDTIKAINKALTKTVDSLDKSKELAYSLRTIAEAERDNSYALRDSLKNAQEKTKNALNEIVEPTLKVVDTLIIQCKFNDAYNLARSIKFSEIPEYSQRKVVEDLLEFAFWYGETGDTSKAWAILEEAYKYEGQSLDPNMPQNRTALRQALHALHPEKHSSLEARYYPVMVPVKGDTFTMNRNTPSMLNTQPKGSDNSRETSHEVALSNFQIAETETTWWQYLLYLESKGLADSLDNTRRFLGNEPVVGISWNDAVKYANWLSERKGMGKVYDIKESTRIKPPFRWKILPDDGLKKEKGSGEEYLINEAITLLTKRVQYENVKVELYQGTKGYRLPTEAEWELAAKGGQNYAWAGTSSEAELGQYAWFRDNAFRSVKPVRSKNPNGFGLYDMTGNVYEWCHDWHNKNYDNKRVRARAPENNPTGPRSGWNRVLRGGSFFSNAEDSRIQDRFINGLAVPNKVGFRVVLVNPSGG